MRQKIDLPIGSRFNVELNSLFCPINKFKAHNINTYDDGYVLDFAVPNYLQEVVIGVWQYTGNLLTEEQEQAQFERDRLYALIASLQNEVETLVFRAEDTGP